MPSLCVYHKISQIFKRNIKKGISIFEEMV
jgi:hypothetical protein